MSLIRDYFFAFIIKLSNNEDVLVQIFSEMNPPESNQGLFLSFYLKLSKNEDVLVQIFSVKTPPESDQGLIL